MALGKCTHGEDVLAEFPSALEATLKMSAFGRFELLVLNPLSQTDNYKYRKNTEFFVKTDASSSFIHKSSERTSDFVCTSTLNPSIFFFSNSRQKDTRE